MDNYLIINKDKSAIIEFINRRCKKTTLKTKEYFCGIPVTNQYKYLGSWFNQKLTLDTHISYMTKKINFIRSHLSSALYNNSLEFRKSLWQMFVIPSFEFGLPIYNFEEAKGKREAFGRLLRNSFRVLLD